MKGRKNGGFTLVELIVVLVILAILAAILIPALLGYIDRAKEKQYMLDAKNVLTATQASFSEAYGLGVNPADENNISGSSNGDISLIGTARATQILQTADVNPYMVIIGAGSNEKYENSTNPSIKHRTHTVYFVAYWPKKDAEPIFFNGSEWMTDYPWSGQGKNSFIVNGEEISLQFYFLAANNKKNLSANWNEIQNALKANKRKVN